MLILCYMLNVGLCIYVGMCVYVCMHTGLRTTRTVTRFSIMQYGFHRDPVFLMHARN